MSNGFFDDPANAGAQGAILANANAIGMGGAGATLGAQLAAQQSAQTNANDQSLGILAAQQQAALAAGQGAANIGSKVLFPASIPHIVVSVP